MCNEFQLISFTYRLFMFVKLSLYWGFLLHVDCNVQVLNTGERCTELMTELEGSRNKMRLFIYLLF